ncbi:MAG: condensation domain-containing protein [Clostridium sp.]
MRESNSVFHSLSDHAVIDKLEHFVGAHNISVATFFIGAYALREMTKKEQVYFLSVESGRHDPRLQHTLGQLIQHVPITVSFEKEVSVMECLQKLQTDFIESWAYDCYPFELLAREHGVSISIMHIYQGTR